LKIQNQNINPQAMNCVSYFFFKIAKPNSKEQFLSHTEVWTGDDSCILPS